MSSFGAMSRIRTGYWLGIRNFLLAEKRTVSNRLQVISTELEKIGWVKVRYLKTLDPATGSSTTSEDRIGFEVAPGTSLSKLVQAYIAIGGNPFDISPFFIPDETEFIWVNDQEKPVENYPYGGVISPKNAEYNEPVGKYHAYPGGFPEVKKFLGNRYGSTVFETPETDEMVHLIIAVRQWANQAIKLKIQEMEHRIIKLMDLREQLQNERNVILTQAFGGTLFDLPDFNPERFTESLRIQNIIETLDSIFFEKDPDGVRRNYTSDPNKLATHESCYPDDVTEILLSLSS